MKYLPEGIRRNEKKFASLDEVLTSIQSGEIIEGRVVLCDSEHNLHIDLGIINGIIPRCEGAIGIEDASVRDIALISRVNKFVAFKIKAVEYDEAQMPYAVLSRRDVQLECKKSYTDKLVCGDIIAAKVTHIESFGAFIDIGAGINSLIPIDMLSVSRINHPSQRVYVGQLIQVVLRKREGDKLTFSLKELLGTWEENARLFSAGETVTGIVRSVEEYGVFVELTPNLAGLAEPYGELQPGQQVSVFIKSIMSEKMKIKLVIVEAFDNEIKNQELKYYIKSKHIDRWDYSPYNAVKQISTDFSS